MEIARGDSGSRRFQGMPCHAGIANMPSARLVRIGSRQSSDGLEILMNHSDWGSRFWYHTGYWVLGPEEERGLE